MATYGKTLLDNASNKILPKTRSKLVYCDDNTILEDRLNTIIDNIPDIPYSPTPLNGLLKPGVYTVRTSQGLSMNFPTNSFYGTLLVGKANNGCISQRLMHYDHGGQYNRVYEIDTKTFSSWSFLSGIMTIGANPGNWNSITETGVYQITTIGTGGPSGAYGYGTLLHFESNAYSHYSAQIYIPHNNDPYVRSLLTRSTNSWANWRKLTSTSVNQV